MRISFCHICTVVAILLSATVQAMDENGKKDYLLWMQENLPVAASFDQWQEKTGALPPDFDALPKTNLLPDPFTFFDGTQVGKSKASWEQRRAEIKSLYEQYEFGKFPPKPNIDRVEVLEQSKGPGYSILSVKLWFGPQSKASVRVRLTIPEAEKGTKLPVLLTTTLSGPGNIALQRGYISAGFAGSDFMDDGAQLQEIYPEYNFSSLPRRAWLVSIVLDYFETLDQIDMDKVAVNGYSRDGKMIMIAAAYDERIAATIAGSTGVGGLVPWRFAGERGGGEGIESTTREFPSWFIPELRFFSGKEDRLPVDANLLLSLVAPRAVLMEWGLNDEVANGWAQERVYDSVLPVYKRLGAPNNLCLMHVPGFHGGNDMAKCLDFLDIQFGRSNKKWSYEAIYSWDFDSWKKASGESLSPNDFQRHLSDSPIANNKEDWESKKADKLAAVNMILGKSPLVVSTPAQSGFFFGGGFNRGPIELLKSNFNPSQLTPDVPAWAISKKAGTFGWTEEDGRVAASKRITFGPDNVKADLYYPVDTPEGKKLPCVIWLHGYHYPLGYMWVYRWDLHPILALVKEGYAVLAFDQSGFGYRYNEYASFYDRFPHWSRLGRMVRDVSDAVTALEKDDLVKKDNISLYGFALGGTVGLHAAALDQRIKNVVSVCGFTPMRSDTAEKGLSGMSRYSHLYGMSPRLGFFVSNEDRIPYDFEDLIALTSPRGVLIVQPSMDRDADVDDVRKAVNKASQVFKWAGAEANLELKVPDDYGRLPNSTQISIVEWVKEHTK